MQTKSGIYWIRNKINNNIYIGSSINIRQRIGNHRRELKHNISPHRLLQNAVNEYGLKNFSYRVLITCHPDMLFWYEQQFIDQWHPEYNTWTKADSSTGFRFSEESKKKMSSSQLGNKNGIGNQNFKGHKHSEEAKKKMSESQKRRRELRRVNESTH